MEKAHLNFVHRRVSKADNHDDVVVVVVVSMGADFTTAVVCVSCCRVLFMLFLISSMHSERETYVHKAHKDSWHAELHRKQHCENVERKL